MTQKERMKSAVELAHALTAKFAMPLLEKGYRITFALRCINAANTIDREEQEYSLWVTINSSLEGEMENTFNSTMAAYFWHNLSSDSPEVLYRWMESCTRELPNLYDIHERI